MAAGKHDQGAAALAEPPARDADLSAAAPAPHPALTAYYPGAPAREAFVRDLFDRTAPAYDRINAAFSLGSGAAYRRHVLRRVGGLRPGQRVLDVAVGTGLVAREAVRITGRPADVAGLDLSAGMLAEARRALPAGVPLVQGRAEALPVADASLDLLTMGYALRHVPDLGAAFAEFRRVLRPGGRVLLLEIGRPAGRLAHAALRFYLGRVVPALSRRLGGGPMAGTLMRYYWDTIEACVPPAAIEAALAGAGLAGVRCDVQLGVFRAYAAERPRDGG